MYIRFGNKLNRQIVSMPMGTNCAPLVADLFLLCYERDFMSSLSGDNQADIIEAFNLTSRYLDDLLNIDNPCFEGMVNASKIYDKRNDFDFDMVNFPFFGWRCSTLAFYNGVYIFQLIRFARVCSHEDDFNARNKCLTAKLLKQGYRYNKLRKAFFKFYRRHYELILKFNVGLKSGLSEPQFYGDLVYKFKIIIGRTEFSDKFRKIIIYHKRIGYDLNAMRQSACLMINPITVDSFATLFNCTPVDRASDSMMAQT